MKYVQQYAALAFLVITLFAYAAPYANAQTDTTMQPDMTIEVGFSERLVLPGQIAEVVIGSSDIADLIPVSTNVYILHANRVGTTNIMALDDNAEVIFYTRLNVRPVDTQPNYSLGVIPGAGAPRTYNCSPVSGCMAAALAGTGLGGTGLGGTGSGGTASGGPCMNPNDIAADGSRCGDRAASERPGGLDGAGLPEN